MLDIEPVAEHIEIDEILHWPLRISYRQKKKKRANVFFNWGFHKLEAGKWNT